MVFPKLPSGMSLEKIYHLMALKVSPSLGNILHQRQPLCSRPHPFPELSLHHLTDSKHVDFLLPRSGPLWGQHPAPEYSWLSEPLLTVSPLLLCFLHSLAEAFLISFLHAQMSVSWRTELTQQHVSFKILIMWTV